MRSGWALLVFWSVSLCGAENLFDSAKHENSKYGHYDEKNKIVSVSVPHTDKVSEATLGVRFILDNKKLAGKNVKFSFKVKTDDVNPGPEKHHIAKMLLSGATTNNRFFRTSDGSNGTSDWKEVIYEHNFYEDNVKAHIVFGLQHCTGTAYFKDLKAEVTDPVAAMLIDQTLPEDFKCEYSDSVKDQAPLRGVVAEYYVFDDPDALNVLDKWNVNLIRLWLGRKRSNLDIKTYEEEINQQFENLKKLCPEFEKHNMKVIITFRVPGGRFKDGQVLGTAGNISAKDNKNSAFRIFECDECLDLFIRLWEKAAKTFRDKPAIWAYDILNEPVQTTTEKYGYLEVQKLAAEAIRKIDGEKPLIIASNYWNSPHTFSYLQPIPLKNVIYQVHFYSPGVYSHQRLFNNKNIVSYPGDINTYGVNSKKLGKQLWDKERLRRDLQPVLEFQKKYDAIIYAGEFSVVRWAPNGATYLDDVASLFEENKWHWTYHTFREKWNGWSLEHPDEYDCQDKSMMDTKRKQILLRYFKKNKE